MMTSSKTMKEDGNNIMSGEEAADDESEENEIASAGVEIAPPIEETMGKKLEELEAKKKGEMPEWSREGCYHQLEHGFNEGQGFYPPPHVLPYKSIGFVDVERDRSLIPTLYQFYKGSRVPKKKVTISEEQMFQGDSVALPLSLKNTFWNGERWCSMEFSPRTAEVLNGFELLHEELQKSQSRLKNCRMGRFFLEGMRLEETRTQSINYPRSSKQILSEFRPYIPPLPLSTLPRYDIDEQLADNRLLLSLYREETKRTLFTPRTPTATNRSSDGGNGGLPPKACEEASMKQLESILNKGAKFEALQAKWNSRLLTQLVSVKSTRAYMYARNFAGLRGIRSARMAVCNLNSTPRITARFRQALLRYPWLEVLIDLIHLNGRRPSTSEIFIIDHIRTVIQRTGNFGANQFGDLVRALEHGNHDINNLAVHRALHFVTEALHLSDVELLTNLLQVRDANLPHWLESRRSLVGKVQRKLQPNRFPMCRFDSPTRPSTTRSLSSLSTRSTVSSLSKRSAKYSRTILSLSLPKTK